MRRVFEHKTFVFGLFSCTLIGNFFYLFIQVYSMNSSKESIVKGLLFNNTIVEENYLSKS